MKKFIVLHPQDSVLICCRQAASGEVIGIDDNEVVLMQDIGLGHKIARHDLSAGDKVIRYGVPIGSATQDIATGEHVHLHNMKSDYIAPTSRETLKEISEFK